MPNQIINSVSYEKFEAQVEKRERIVSHPNHPFAVLFFQHTPKAKFSTTKVIKYFVYKTQEEATDAAQKWIDNIRTFAERRKADKAERKAKDLAVNAADFYKEGDIIVNSWGWEQTNVNFYQVMKVGKRTIEILEIYGQRVEGSDQAGGMACDMTACKDSFKEDGDKYRLTVKAEGRLSNPESYYHMVKWNEKPQYRSWYA